MKLSTYMSEHGLDDEAMAARIGGCSPSAVKKWKYGERLPRSDALRRIAEVTDGAVTANDLLPRETEAAE